MRHLAAASHRAPCDLGPRVEHPLHPASEGRVASAAAGRREVGPAAPAPRSLSAPPGPPLFLIPAASQSGPAARVTPPPPPADRTRGRRPLRRPCLPPPE